MLDTISPVGGWVLDHAVELDRRAPGFAGRYLRASDERRQVIAAFFAAMTTGKCDSPLNRETSAFLDVSDHAAILHRAFGIVPAGFRGALGRAGPQPHEARFYTLLHQTLSRPVHKPVALAIRHLPFLDLMKLRVAHALPASICTDAVITLVDTVKGATDVSTALDLLVEHGADEAALVEAIRRASTASELAAVWKRWVGRTVFAEHPVPASEAYMPVTTAADLKRLGRRFSNCAEHHIVNCLAEQCSFGEYRSGDRALVVHLRRRGGEWIVVEALGKNNKRPDPGLKEEAFAYLADHGVKPVPKPQPARNRWAVLNRLCSYRFFGFEEDD